jgi:site-specific recombinase XerD
MQKFNAWIETTKAGNYQIRYRDQVTGKKKTYEVVGKDAKAEVNGKWRTGKWLADSCLQNLQSLYYSNKLGFSTSSESLEKLVETYLEEKKGLAWKTLIHYEGALTKMLKYFGSTDRLTVENLIAWRQELTKRYKNSTIHGTMNDTRVFCKWLVKRKKISTSPFFGERGLVPAQSTAIPRFYTTQEFVALDRALEALNHHARVGCHLARDYGLRMVEIVGDGLERPEGVRWEDIIWRADGQADLLIRKEVTKGQKKSRKVHLEPDFIQMLGSRRTGPLVPLKRSAFWGYFKKARLASGIKKNLTMHGQRHTFGKNFAQNSGANLRALADLLGHSDIKTTMIYTQFEQTYLDAAQEKMAQKVRQDDALAKNAEGQKATNKIEIIETSGNLKDTVGTNNEANNDTKSGTNQA